MYRTRILFQPIATVAIRMTADPYKAHQFVKELVPEGRYLYDFIVSKQGVCLDLVSPCMPNLAPLKPFKEVLAKEPSSRESTALPAVGATFRFKLRATPSRHLPNTKVRVGIVGEGEQIAWLRRQGARLGFTIAPGQVVADDQGLISFSKSRDDRPIRYVDCHYTGYLTVTDPQAFRTAMADGVGRGKAFGFGMLRLGAA